MIDCIQVSDRSVLHNDTPLVSIICRHLLYSVHVMCMHILCSLYIMRSHFSYSVNADRGSRKNGNGNGEKAASSAAILESKKRKGTTSLTTIVLCNFIVCVTPSVVFVFCMCYMTVLHA